MDLELNGEQDVDHYSVTINYSTGTGSGSFDTANVKNPGMILHFPTTDDSSLYVYTLGAIVDNNGCVAPADSMSGSASVKVYQTPEPEIISAPSSVCGPVAALEAAANKGGEGHWFLQSGSASVDFSDPEDPLTDATISPLDKDLQIMEYGWVLRTPRCADTAFTTVTYYEEPDPPPYVETDPVEIYFSDTLTIEAKIPTAGTGRWDPIGGSAYVDADTSYRTLARELSMDEPNKFIWTVTNGACGSISDTLTVIRNDITQYDGFSPNSDDKNRYFVMRGLASASDFTFTVFNNWGTKIRTVTRADAEARGYIDQGEAEHELILWDGTDKNGESIVPDGTYYYHIRIVIGPAGREESYDKTGYIILKTR